MGGFDLPMDDSKSGARGKFALMDDAKLFNTQALLLLDEARVGEAYDAIGVSGSIGLQLMNSSRDLSTTPRRISTRLEQPR